MTDESKLARSLAINCEALKWSYRQTKEGVVVSFLVHPQQVPDGLAVAALGTRYILAMVQLGDDELPVPPDKKEVTPAKPRPDSTSHATGGARSWHEMSPTEQSGILCKEPAFAKFLAERYPNTWDSMEHKNGVLRCVEFVHEFCHVKSRSDLKRGDANWNELAAGYKWWMRAPEVV